MHDASTDRTDVSMRVGLRTILPLGAEIPLTLVPENEFLEGIRFCDMRAHFWNRLARKNNYVQA